MFLFDDVIVLKKQADAMNFFKCDAFIPDDCAIV